MITTEILIPDDCHITVNGEDIAGKKVWNFSLAYYF
jgi:hypothetical protein